MTRKKFILLLVIFLVVLVLAVGINCYNTKYVAHPHMIEFTHYNDSRLGIAFDYPTVWNFHADVKNQTTEYSFTAPEFAGTQIGTRLLVDAAKFSSGKTPGPSAPPCPPNRQAGTLTINKKIYPRCDVGSGLYVYSVVVSEHLADGDLVLQFSYNSSDPKNLNTKAIEAIIESFTF